MGAQKKIKTPAMSGVTNPMKSNQAPPQSADISARLPSAAEVAPSRTRPVAIPMPDNRLVTVTKLCNKP
jgi:hypothetical protein